LITLVVTDNSGNTYTKKITRTIEADAPAFESEGQSVLQFNFLFVIVGSVIAALVCLAVVFRNRIQMFVLDHRINSMSQNIHHKNNHIKKIKSKSK